MIHRSGTRTGAAAIALTALALGACASRPNESSAPELVVGEVDRAGFAADANGVFERRCGSLDCHGQLPRGLRIYGANGLRLPNDAGLVPGGGATTPAEIAANYDSIVGLQPDQMNAFLLKTPRTEDDARHLLVLAKPLALERHKGGTSLSLGEPAEQCIVTWLLGHADHELCAKASRLP